MALIPSQYKIDLDINDADIFKIALSVYIAIIAVKIFKARK